MNQPTRILAVDDEPGITEMIDQYLSGLGFEVATATDVATARQILDAQPVDLLLLDVNMPGEDGISFAASFDGPTRPAIIMLTAMDGLDDRLRGLGAGADDYVAKPFEPRELLARIRSVMRRMPDRPDRDSDEEDGAPTTVAFGPYRLDLRAHSLTGADGEEIPLTSMEFDLLKAFAERPGRILNRDQLAELAHQRAWSPDDRSIDIRIARLRKKIERDPRNPEWIETVRGEGYRFKPSPS